MHSLRQLNNVVVQWSEKQLVRNDGLNDKVSHLECRCLLRFLHDLSAVCGNMFATKHVKNVLLIFPTDRLTWPILIRPAKHLSRAKNTALCEMSPLFSCPSRTWNEKKTCVIKQIPHNERIYTYTVLGCMIALEKAYFSITRSKEMPLKFNITRGVL